MTIEEKPWRMIAFVVLRICRHLLKKAELTNQKAFKVIST